MATSIIKNSVDLLWTNPNPTAAFSAQTISLDLSAYKGVLVCFSASNDVDASSRTRASFFAWKGATNFMALSSRTSDFVFGGRQFSVTETGVSFLGGYYRILSNASPDTNNEWMIPQYIYGVK